jgi:photosystem II stability/assembly factor-like uncharacterized protein
MYQISFLSLVVCLFTCTEQAKNNPITEVQIQTIFEDSVSIRAIEIVDNTLRFAGSKGMFGEIDMNTHEVLTNVQMHDSLAPEFRAIASNKSGFFMLSVASPALLYRTDAKGETDLVYTENGEGVFYDSMTFLDDTQGIAVGDNVNGCFSIIRTSDGGETWQKIPCKQLPELIEGEGAFAASNTNIEVKGKSIWIATTKRIIYSSDAGESWTTQDYKVSTIGEAAGVYSIDFYDENNGIAFGGDYTQADTNTNNISTTQNGGKTWEIVTSDSLPGYRSCVQYIPNSNGKELVAIGFKGIDYSKDGGKNWKHLSDESFYTLRFLNAKEAYAAGANRIAKLVFK